MTLEMARLKARCVAAVTGEPAVIYRDAGCRWGVWHTLDAAKWLGADGEVVLPETLQDPAGTERRLREEARTMRGPARLRLLEAAMEVRFRNGRPPEASAGVPVRTAPRAP